MAQKEEALRRVMEYQEKHGIIVEPSEVSISLHHQQQQLLSPGSRGFPEQLLGHPQSSQHAAAYYIQQQSALPYTPSAVSIPSTMQHIMPHPQLMMHQPPHLLHSNPPMGHFDQYHQHGAPPVNRTNEVMQHGGGEMMESYYDQNGHKHTYYHPMNYHVGSYDAMNPHNQYDPVDEGHHQQIVVNGQYNRVPRPDDFENSSNEQYNTHMHYQSNQDMGHFINHDEQFNQNMMLQQQQGEQYNHQYNPSSSYHSDPRMNANFPPYDSTYPGSWEGSPQSQSESVDVHRVLQRDVEEDGAFIDSNAPIDEAMASQVAKSSHSTGFHTLRSPKSQVDPPEDEPPSLSKYKQLHPAGKHANSILATSTYSVHSAEGSQLVSSACLDDDYYSSPDKTSRYGDPYKNDHIEHDEYTGEYEYDYQLESDSPSGNPRHFEQNDQQQQIPIADSYTTGDVEEKEVVSQSTDNDFVLSPSSNFSIPISEGEFATEDIDSPTSSGSNKYPSPTETETGRRDHGLPPHSPRSAPGSDFSQSSALRGAQELLRRNRARRMSARKQREDDGRGIREGEPTEAEDPSTPLSVNSQSEFESGGTWESTSEMTSVVSGSSSGWTENETNPDRNSRRALILQMAKARMRSNKSASGTTPTSTQSRVDLSHSISDVDSPKQQHRLQFDEEEKKIDYREGGTEINLIGELD